LVDSTSDSSSAQDHRSVPLRERSGVIITSPSTSNPIHEKNSVTESERGSVTESSFSFSSLLQGVMGIFGSKEDDGIDRDAIKNAGEVYETDRIFYDNDGNLRFGKKPRIIKDEIKLFQARGVDDTEEEDGKLWYIIDGPWLASWLAFVQISDENFTFPDPGPCDNKRLLQHNKLFEGWEAREGLTQASKADSGDFRRITQKAWELYTNLYPGSGPAITCVARFPKADTEEKELDILSDDKIKSKDPYSTDYWLIDQDNYEPPKEAVKLLKKKKARLEAAKDLVDSEEAQILGIDLLRQNRAEDSDDEDVRSKDSDDESDGHKKGVHSADSDDESDGLMVPASFSVLRYGFR